MTITECKLTVMENLMFVSSEFGNEYHACGFIGNTAIPYALGFCPVTYVQFKTPQHRIHFTEISRRGIYITPVTFDGNVAFKVERFNCTPDAYDLTWKDDPSEKGGRTENYPDEGTFKMIARGNVGVFYIVSNEPVPVPAYIRVGKFMSKCKIETRLIRDVEEKRTGDHEAGIILRAEDIDPSVEILSYEKVPIQHGMYIRNARFRGKAWRLHSTVLGKDVCIPDGTAFYKALEGVAR